MRSHAAVAAELLGDRALVDAVLADPASAPITDAEKALFAFVTRVNQASFEVTREHVDAVVRAGCPEEAVYDAITVCALFNFYNRWCDSAGVHAMAHDDHAASGARMARHGYLPPQAAPAPHDGSRSG